MFEVWITDEAGIEATLFGVYDDFAYASYMAFISGGEVLEV